MLSCLPSSCRGVYQVSDFRQGCVCSSIINSRVVLWEVKAQANDSEARGPCAAAQPGTHSLSPSPGAATPNYHPWLHLNWNRQGRACTQPLLITSLAEMNLSCPVPSTGTKTAPARLHSVHCLWILTASHPRFS